MCVILHDKLHILQFYYTNCNITVGRCNITVALLDLCVLFWGLKKPADGVMDTRFIDRPSDDSVGEGEIVILQW